MYEKLKTELPKKTPFSEKKDKSDIVNMILAVVAFIISIIALTVRLSR